MPKVALYDVSGAQIRELELNDNIFGIEPNQAVLYDFVKMQLSNKRVGTASSKTRAEVRGGGKKPWRQKGTGRARVGSTRNPIWREDCLDPSPEIIPTNCRKGQKAGYEISSFQQSN